MTGAEYGVYSEINNQLVEKVISNKEGIMQGSINEEGSYCLKEIQAPSGYSLSDKEIPFTIANAPKGYEKAKNINIEITPGCNKNLLIVDNEVLGSFQVSKLGKDGAKLDGATFKVTGPNNFKKEIITDKDGIASFKGLAWGTYNIKETKAPIGYNLNPEAQQIIINRISVEKVQKLIFKDRAIKVITNHKNNSSPLTGDSSQLPIYIILIGVIAIFLNINKKR